MEKELLKKYLENNCIEKELEEVIRLIKNDSLNLAWKKEALNIWKDFDGTEQLDETSSNSILDKIHHKINISSQNTLNNKKSLLSTITSYLAKAAAILFIPVTALLFYTISKDKIEQENLTKLKIDSIEIASPVGSRSEIQLADGSVVYLNHGSKLKYPQRFYGNTRGVILSGEAYFKVVHNPEMPFVVRTTGGLNITALGTEFNVLAYPDENNIEATLVNGKVKIEKHTENEGLKDVGVMIPGQHVNYSKLNDDIWSEMGNIERYISWKEGKLVFKDESIVTIGNKLSRWYNVEFEFEDAEALEYPYTATFVDESLTQILDLLKLATPIDYKILSREKLHNGTFSKQKVVIWKIH